MLAIQARSFNNYLYLASNNTNQPARFIDNKITGTLYENKIEYASTFYNVPPSPLPPSYSHTN
jgi:endo-1,3(4)-beta-glucanase